MELLRQNAWLHSAAGAPDAPAHKAEFSLLQPGKNCWRVEHAHRASWLIDGENYFAAFRAAALKATQSIFIIGWDVHSRAVLPGPCQDGLPLTLSDFLSALLHRRRKLRIFVLDWDFAMLYARDRELLPLYTFGWRSHRRLAFRLDGNHPRGASHHQKVVVIDGKVAFVGGLDLTKGRWDTQRHLPADPRRVDPYGVPYRPFHDIQLMVDGNAAAALGELARERWQRLTRLAPRTLRVSDDADPWPDHVAPAMTNVNVGIARTLPKFAQQEEVKEVKQLFLDTIAAARRSIYIENQYLTSDAIGNALAARLDEPDGPEIVIVSRLRGGGWLEENTMEALRARLIRRLRAADRHDRLRIYYPHNCKFTDQECIELHSKLMIVDDSLLRIGSANLNNRSMGVDTECDLAIEAGDAEDALAIARLRHELLAEHLGTTPETVAQAFDGSLISTIERLRGGERSLEPIPVDAAPPPDALGVDRSVLDPEQPIEAERLAKEILPLEQRPPASRRIATGLAILGLFATLALAWRWTPLSGWLNLDNLTALGARVSASPLAPAWILGVYVLAAIVAVPITLVIFVTVLVFGPLEGWMYALSGVLIGALVTYGIGHWLGRDTVRRLAGSRLNKLSKRLAKHGILAIFAVRIVPVAPFTVINLVAGASHIRLRDYIIGTVLGMVPGISALTLFSDRLAHALRAPSGTTLALLIAALLAIGVGTVFLHRWLTRRVGATHGTSSST